MKLLKTPVLVVALSALTPSGSPAAGEPPGAWFLNAQGTGGDYVYFSVGGSVDQPPTEAREVLLGWSWDDAGNTVDRYPASVPARYQPSRYSGKRPRQWFAEGWHAGVPPLGVGPGRELLILGDGEPSTDLAMRWAEMLDSVEAAYRHSSPDLNTRERRGTLDIGRIGRCTIKSVPVDGDERGWSTLRLTGHARRSRTGGHYYIDPYEGSQGPLRSIRVQRFMRFLEGSEDCGGSGLTMTLIPAPREEDFSPAYFLVWSNLVLQPLSFLDLEPTPRTPAVRTLARVGGLGREEINIASWPTAGDAGVDLCQAPFMKTLCLKDLRIREQLATSAVFNPEVANPLRAGCREIFDQLGALPSRHPCSNPRVWRQSTGVYRAGYTGDLVLSEKPRLISRVNDAGEVQWLWPESQPPSSTVELPLIDGTRIALGLPQTSPTNISEPPPQISRLPPRPPPSDTSEPLPSATETRPPPAQVAEPRPPSASSSAPPPANTEVATSPSPTTANAEPSPPQPANTPAPTWSAPEQEPNASSPPPAIAPEVGQPAPATHLPTHSEATSSESPDEAGLSVTAPVKTPAPSWLWPFALMALGMTASVAFLLRGQRVSARSRRQALSSGLIAEESVPELLIEDESQDEPLLGGRETSDTPSEELSLESAIEDGSLAESDLEAPAEADEYSPDSEPESESVSPPATPNRLVSPLEPPELADGLPATPITCWTRLAAEHRALEVHQRQGMTQCLATISRLGEWISCLLPVLQDIENGRGDLPSIDQLPPPAQREWRESHQVVREFADFDLVVLHRLNQELNSPPQSGANDDGGAEAQYLSGAGLLDSEHGSLVERLRRHLLKPGIGRLQELVLALQYLIEAYTVEHLKKAERKAYLGAIKARLDGVGLSTKFHLLVEGVVTGLGLAYRQIRYYKARIDDADQPLEVDSHAAFDLSQRVGYSAGTEDGVIVRLSELFLSDAASGDSYSGQAWIDRDQLPFDT